MKLSDSPFLSRVSGLRRHLISALANSNILLYGLYYSAIVSLKLTICKWMENFGILSPHRSNASCQSFTALYDAPSPMLECYRSDLGPSNIICYCWHNT